MKRTATLWAFALLLLLGCTEGEPPQTPEQKPISTQKSKPKPKKPAVDTNMITDENVEHKLLAYGKANPETVVKVHTTKGVITIRLFKDTPLHRANFIMLAKKGYFEGTVFMRVVKGFMAQGGAAYSADHTDIKRGIGNYTIPPEFRSKYIHRQGAVAAAREYRNNPDKRSDPYMFYMVEGVRFTDETLDKYERKTGTQYTKAQRDYYTQKPGAAHLDGEHTVFGEIIAGYAVIPKMTAVETDRQDWPIDDIFIEKVEVLR
jgi:peptidyl-prolyl cis-trans isomerase A (cyclophilin A)